MDAVATSTSYAEYQTQLKQLERSVKAYDRNLKAVSRQLKQATSQDHKDRLSNKKSALEEKLMKCQLQLIGVNQKANAILNQPCPALSIQPSSRSIKVFQDAVVDTIIASHKLKSTQAL